MSGDGKYLKRLSDYDEIPGTDYLIEPYVPIGALIFVCALPKGLKTYLANDWAHSIAVGHQWLGRTTRKGRAAYCALENYKGVLRRAEARRIFHKKSKSDMDDLAYVTDPISFAEKTCNIDQHLTVMKNNGFRPDVVTIDTWFKATPGVEASDQADMSVALKNMRSFQSKLSEWKVEDGLPEVTVIVVAHTDKKGQALFGSVAQFADCDVLYQMERIAPDQATLSCIGARDIEEPPAITFQMQKVEIVTAKGKEINLVVSKEVSILDQPVGETRQTKQDAKKAAKEITLDDLAFRTLVGFFRGPQSWTGWTEWFEVTKAARGKTGLGTETFDAIVKRLVEAGRVRKNSEGLYQVVLREHVEADAEASTPASAPAHFSTSTSDFSNLRFEKSEKSEVTSRSTSGSARSTRSNSTESGNAQNSVVPDAGHDAVEQLSEGKKIDGKR